MCERSERQLTLMGRHKTQENKSLHILREYSKLAFDQLNIGKIILTEREIIIPLHEIVSGIKSVI